MFRLKYVSPERDKFGAIRYRFRAPWGRCVMASRDPESREFRLEYDQLMARRATPASAPASVQNRAGSLEWLVELHMRSAAWKALAPATQTQRRHLLGHLVAEHGRRAAALLDARAVRALRDAKADTPGAANNLLKALSGLYTWAVEAGHVETNPVPGVKRMKLAPGGFTPWTVDQVRAYWDHHPLGTKAHLALTLILFTALRRGDAVVAGRQHIRQIDGLPWLRLAQGKTGQVVEVPLMPQLVAAIDATQTGDLAFLVTDYGRPFTKAGFGGRFRKWVDEVPGLPKDLAAHGLRKAAGEILAECGCTELEIMAILGHATAREGATYTRGANRRKLAASAAAKMRAAGI